VDAQTEELRHAHDVLAGWYAQRLAGVLESMPVERAVLDLFSELTPGRGSGRRGGRRRVRDRPARTVPGLARTFATRRRPFPGHDRGRPPGPPAFPFEVADLRDLPFPESSLAGVLCCAGTR